MRSARAITDGLAGGGAALVSHFGSVGKQMSFIVLDSFGGSGGGGGADEEAPSVEPKILSLVEMRRVQEAVSFERGSGGLEKLGVMI